MIPTEIVYRYTRAKQCGYNESITEDDIGFEKRHGSNDGLERLIPLAINTAPIYMWQTVRVRIYDRNR